MSSHIGNADANATEVDRPRQGARRKDPLLVEDAVVRQIHFEAHRNGAAVEQCIGIEDLVALAPRQADEHAGPAIGGLASEPLAGVTADILKGRLENEILGRIARKEQLGKHDEVGPHPRRLGARRAGLWLRCRPRRQRWG